MKIIQYHLKTIGENGETVQGPACSMTYSEANLEIAEAEAFGKVEITDDGQPEPEANPSEADVTLDLLADHEYRLCMLELGGELL